MLELGKHQVVSEVADGVDTLEKFNSANPDVLLTQQYQKRRLETLQTMKSNPNAKVVIITAH